MRQLRSFFILILCVSCIERYMPPLNEDNSRFLVVDGNISSDGTATVRLTNSVPLTHADRYPAERDAVVEIESSSGKIFALTEADSVTYTISNADFDLEDHYMLHIKTNDGHEYRSDEVKLYPTPPIDNISWNINASRDLVEIRVDSSDPNPDATGFYLYDMVETYQYHAPVYVGYKIVNGLPKDRERDELVYTCWRNINKESVLLNTNYLSENVISKYAVTRVEKGSIKLMIAYSILVKQRAISEDEYAFRVQLQNSTEQQGSLFSVIPGSVVGNIHSTTHPGEFVLGYFRMQDVKERRLFIYYKDLPDDFHFVRSLGDCQPKTTCNAQTGEGFDCTRVEQLGNDALIVSANVNNRGVVTSYNWVTRECGDCRQEGGTTIRPPFWQ